MEDALWLSQSAHRGARYCESTYLTCAKTWPNSQRCRGDKDSATTDRRRRDYWGREIGCNIAYHLGMCGTKNVVVLEREFVGSGTMSEAAGGMRVQFPSDIEIAFYGLDGLLYTVGSRSHGFQRSPVAGKVVAELILNDRSLLDISAVSLAQFQETIPLFLEGNVPKTD
jgi:hypothetical protein